MSEITYIKCDQVGCESRINAYPTPGTEEFDVRNTWEKDDLDADVCPDCQMRIAKEAKESDVDLATFGEVLGRAADQAEAEMEAAGLEKTRSLDELDPNDKLNPIKYVLPDNFDEVLEGVIKDTVKDLKKQKATKEVIDETVRLIREEAAQMKAVAIKPKKE